MTDEVTSTSPLVMVIDDDQDSLILVTTLLDICGYRSFVASNYAEAIRGYAQSPEVILLDLVMPDAASEKFLSMLAAKESETPILLMSAAGPEQLHARQIAARKMGLVVSATLAKPFWVDPLAAALSKALPNALQDDIFDQANT